MTFLLRLSLASEGGDAEMRLRGSQVIRIAHLLEINEEMGTETRTTCSALSTTWLVLLLGFELELELNHG